MRPPRRGLITGGRPATTTTTTTTPSGGAPRRPTISTRRRLLVLVQLVLLFVAILETSASGHFKILNDQHSRAGRSQPSTTAEAANAISQSNNAKQTPKQHPLLQPVATAQQDKPTKPSSMKATKRDLVSRPTSKSERETLLSSASQLVPQFDDDDDKVYVRDELARSDELQSEYGELGGSPIGLTAATTYTLEPSGGPTPRFNWSEEKEATDDWRQVWRQQAPAMADNPKMLALAKLFGDSRAKYQAHIQRTLDSIRPQRSLKTFTTSGQISNSSRPFRHYDFEEAGQHQDSAEPSVSLFNLRTKGPVWNETNPYKNPDGPHPNKMFLSTKQQQQHNASEHLFKQSNHVLVGGEVKVSSDLVLVKDQSNRPDPSGLGPVRTLSEKVRFGGGSGAPSKKRPAARPSAPNEILIVNIEGGSGTDDGYMVINKDDLNDAREAGVNSVKQLMLTRLAPSAPAQSHRLTVNLTDLFQRQANQQTTMSTQLAHESEPSSYVTDDDTAAKRTSDEDDADDNSLGSERGDELNLASSTTGFRRVSQPAPLARFNDTRDKPATSSSMEVNRKLGLASLDIGGRNKHHQLPPAPQQLVKSASASTSEIRVTIGNGERPVFINNRGLILAARKNTTARPLYNPSKLFASSQGSHTLHPLDATKTHTKDRFGGQAGVAAATGSTVDHKTKNKSKHGSGANLSKNKLAASINSLMARPQFETVTLEPLEVVSNFEVGASPSSSSPSSSSSSFGQSNHSQTHNWTNGIHFQALAPLTTSASTTKRNSSQSNKVSLGESPASGTKQMLASTVVSSLLVPEQTTKQHSWSFEANNTLPGRNMTTAMSLDEEQPDTDSGDNNNNDNRFNTTRHSYLSATTLAAGFNHNPPYHQPILEPVTPPTDFGFNTSPPAAANSSSFQSGNNRNSSRPNNRFHAPQTGASSSSSGGIQLSSNNNKLRPVAMGSDDSSTTATNHTFGHTPNIRNTSRRPPATKGPQHSQSQASHTYESTTSSSVNLGEPANTLQHLNSSVATTTTNGTIAPKPSNKIRFKLHNLLLNKFLIKPIQQQAQAAANQLVSNGAGGSGNGVSPLLSNTMANNMAQLLASKLTSLVRPNQPQAQHSPPPQSPLNSLFGFRVPSSSQATSGGSAFTKLKQRVGGPFGGQPGQAGLGPLSHRRTTGVGPLLFSGLVYGLTVLPALMALTGINPFSAAGADAGSSALAAYASSAASSSLAANRHSGERSKTRTKLRPLASDADDSSDAFAYLIPLVSHPTTLPATTLESDNDQRQTASVGPLRPSNGVSGHLGDEPQSSALRALYAPPPTVLEPIRSGSDLSGILDEAPELDWTAYTGRPGRDLHDQYPNHQHHHNRQVIELSPPPPTIAQHYSERKEAPRFVTAARRHRDLTSVGGWQPSSRATHLLGAPDNRLTAGGAQQSIGSILFEQPNVRDDAQQTRWNQVQQLNQLQELQQQLQRDQQRQQQQLQQQQQQQHHHHHHQRQQRQQVDSMRWNVGIDGSDGGMRQRRTIVNHQVQQGQPPGNLGDAPPLANNQHKSQGPPPVSHKSFSSELQAFNRDQLQSSLIGAIDQGRQMLNLIEQQSVSSVPTSSFLQQQNKLIQSHADNNHDDGQDKLNRLRASVDSRDHSNVQTPKWSSASEWRAINPPPGPKDLSTRGDIETVVGRKYRPADDDEHKNLGSTTKRPKRKKTAGSKKRQPSSSNQSSSTTTKAPPPRNLLGDGGESELILAHSMAMGSRILNEPVEGRYHY